MNTSLRSSLTAFRGTSQVCYLSDMQTESDTVSSLVKTLKEPFEHTTVFLHGQMNLPYNGKAVHGSENCQLVLLAVIRLQERDRHAHENTFVSLAPKA